ncbi:RNA binding protein, partial [Oryctes borbonicus]
EELWQLFQPCGEIESVRLVRDRHTDIGKGFGYINFKSSDSVELALQMGEVKLRDRVIRVSLSNDKAPKKQKPLGPQKQSKNRKPVVQKDSSETITTATRGQFQGKFANTKKQNKFNKGSQQKKKLAKKIAPKTILGST